MCIKRISFRVRDEKEVNALKIGCDLFCWSFVSCLLFFIHSPHSNSRKFENVVKSANAGILLGEPNLHPDTIAAAKVQIDQAADERGNPGDFHADPLSSKVVRQSSDPHPRLPLHDMSVPQRERSAQSSFTSVFSGDYSNFASLTKSHFNPAN